MSALVFPVYSSFFPASKSYNKVNWQTLQDDEWQYEWGVVCLYVLALYVGLVTYSGSPQVEDEWRAKYNIVDNITLNIALKCSSHKTTIC